MKALALALCLALPAWGWTHIGSNIGGWSTRNLSVKVNPTNCTIETSVLTGLIDSALAAWNQVPTIDLQLSRDPVDSTLSYSDFSSGAAAGSLFFYCDPSFSSTNGVDGDYVPAATRAATDPQGHLNLAVISLNSESGMSAEISGLDSQLLLVILAHELGHALGLGHSSRSEALMYYSVSNKSHTTLAQDDIDGLAILYPRNEFSYGAFGCASVKGNAPGPGFGTYFAFCFLLCLVFVGRQYAFKLEPLPVLPESLP